MSKKEEMPLAMPTHNDRVLDGEALGVHPRQPLAELLV